MDFLEKLESNSILIIPNNLKDKVLDYLNKNNILKDIKIQTFNDLKKGLLFDYTNEAIYHVMKNFNVNYGVARNYINNIYYLTEEKYDNAKLKLLLDIKKSLIANNLLIYDSLFKNLVDSKDLIYVYGFDHINKFNQYLLDLCKEYADIKYLEKRTNDYKHAVYEYKTIEDEVIGLCEKISDLVNKGVSLNKIYIANYSNEYYFTFHRIFKLYNIPYFINSESSLYDTVIGRYFIDNLDNNLTKLLWIISKKFDCDNNLYSNTVYSKLSSLVNNYYWTDTIVDIKDLVVEEMKKVKIPTKHYEEEIKTTNLIDNDFDDDEYVFLIGFNLGSVPKVKKDEDYINDSIKTNVIETSIEANNINKASYLNAIKNAKNLTISYKLSSPFETYYPSFLIDKNYLYKEEGIVTYSKYSDNLNKILLTKGIDSLIKFNELNDNLSVLNNNYNIPYKEYTNAYTGVDKYKVFNILSKKTFSYSSISTYFKCPFRFYLSFFYRLDKYEQTIDTFIGSLFHKVMEDCINDESKDIDKVYDDFIEECTLKEDDTDTRNKREFNNHDKYFVEKLRSEVHFIVDNIRKQYKHSSHNKNEEWHEKEFKFNFSDLDLNTDVKSSIIGFVDKCLVINNDIVIIDYKTGTSDHILPDYFEFGLCIQLPIYYYLLKNKNKDFNIVGMYLQHILTGFPKKEKNKNLEDIRLNGLKLDGLTLDDEKKIKLFDDSYAKSEVIQGLRRNAEDSGWTYKNRVISYDEQDDLYNLIKTLLENAINDIADAKFDIAPINVDNHDGCDFCKYRDICFKRPYDTIYKTKTGFRKEEDENE